jgi:hypothetical protein
MNRPSPLVPALAAATVLLAGGHPAAAQASLPRVLTHLETVKGSEDVALRWPVAVAAASDEEIAVADAFESRLLRFRRVGVSWQLDASVKMPGTPVSLAWDGSRYVASLRQGEGVVAFEGPDLERRRLPLPRGTVPGPMAAYPNGDLLVYDWARGRALRLSRDGDATGEVEIGDGVTAVTPSPTGGFFAAVAARGSVLHFSANGSLEATWKLPAFEDVPAWPVGLVAEPGGTLLVVDRHLGRLVVLDSNGEVIGLGAARGWDPGLLLSPAGITRLPSGLVLVADEGNGRAQVFRPTGTGAEP